MTRSAPIAVISFVLGACGAEEWSFDSVGTDAGTRTDVSTDVSTGGCSSDDDCLLKTLHCDVETGQCVACVKNYQCPDYEVCETMMLHRCVQCLGDSDCPPSQPSQKCLTTTYQCVPSCMDDSDCPMSMSARFCSPSHVCVGCLNDSQCANGDCDPNIGQCAECMFPLDCASEVCDRTTDRCVGCLNSSTCSPGEACDPYRLECVGPMDAGSFASRDSPDEVSLH